MNGGSSRLRRPWVHASHAFKQQYVYHGNLSRPTPGVDTYAKNTERLSINHYKYKIYVALLIFSHASTNLPTDTGARSGRNRARLPHWREIHTKARFPKVDPDARWTTSRQNLPFVLRGAMQVGVGCALGLVRQRSHAMSSMSRGEFVIMICLGSSYSRYPLGADSGQALA